MPSRRIIRVKFRGTEEDCIAGQLIVKLKAADPAKLLRDIIGPGVSIVRPFDKHGIGLIEVSERASLEEVANRLESHRDVVFARPNPITSVSLTPSDPRYVQQWPLKLIGAEGAWDRTMGSERVVIAIADSGIPLSGNPPKLSHEDLLTPRFKIGTDFINGDQAPADDNGHGTHVVGIASADGNNRRGIIGLAPFCTVLVLKVFDGQGHGSYFDLYLAVIESVDFAANSNRRLVINFSGGGSNDHPVLREAVNAITTVDGILCAAAGNEGGPVNFPAALAARLGGGGYSRVIAVGNSTRNDTIAQTSNRGPEITVVAPGEGVLSTLPPDQPGGGYGIKSGTSMAAPLVAALVGLVWSLDNDLSADQVVNAITSTAVDLGAPGRDTIFGFGRIDASGALRAVDRPPIKPGDPLPKPLPWPIPPMPPPAVAVIFPDIHNAGSSMAEAIWRCIRGRPHEAKRHLLGAQNAARRAGIFRHFDALNAAISSPGIGSVTQAHRELRAQAYIEICNRAGWIGLGAMYDTGYTLIDAASYASYENDKTQLLGRLDEARRQMEATVVYGPTMFEIDRVRSEVERANELWRVSGLIRELSGRLCNALPTGCVDVP
jgi:thermitase